ncbi:MAG: N-acetylornithine carbamoyltransferase [Pyrinomonadaceae bacterium]
MQNNFLNTGDFSRDELEDFIQNAFAMKRGELNAKTLGGRSIALVFFNPSLRTRASMQVGIYELGGNAVILEPGGTSWTLEHRDGAVMDGSKTEHLKEFVRVLERYVSAIGVRTFADLQDWKSERADPILSAFANYASKPIINLESAMHHPCQAMADMMTIRERFGHEKKKVLLTWAWHPKPLPMAVPNSFALAAAQFGQDVRIAHPAGYELDKVLLTQIQASAELSGGSLEFTNDPDEAFDDVDIVYAKSWGGKQFYGNAEADMQYRSQFRARWIVDDEKMRRSNDGIFMHCLPVRRNVIVTDSVIDSSNSVVIDQAENRLHIQKAIIASSIK